MSPKHALALAVTSAVVLAGCGGGDYKKQTITLLSKGTDVALEDQPPRGPSAGDERALTQRLVTEDGKPAGRLDGTVAITNERGKVEDRVGTVQFTLDGGTIVVSGVYSAPAQEVAPVEGVTRPIVGGTGKYENARGVVKQSPEGEEVRNVIEVETPDS